MHKNAAIFSICRPFCGASSSLRAALLRSCRTAFSVHRPPPPCANTSSSIADQRTWNAIYASYAALIAADALPMQTAFFPPESDTVLKPGAKSPSVYVLQLMLSEIAPHYNRIAAVPLTGEYDSDTQAAVRRAQQIFQLPQTGLTDRATWQALTGLHNALFRRTPLGWQINGDTHRSGCPASNRP